jgi:hypothetical protein
LPFTEPTSSDQENVTKIHSTNTFITTTSSKCNIVNCSIYQITNYTSCVCDCKENWYGPDCQNYNCSIPDSNECSANTNDCLNQTLFFKCPNKCSPYCRQNITTTTRRNRSPSALPDTDPTTSNHGNFTTIHSSSTFFAATSSKCSVLNCSYYQIFNQSTCVCDCRENWYGPACQNYNCSIPDPNECTINETDCLNQTLFFKCPKKCSPYCRQNITTTTRRNRSPSALPDTDPTTSDYENFTTKYSTDVFISTTSYKCSISNCSIYQFANYTSCECDCKENWYGPECQYFNCSMPDPYECTINETDCSNKTIFFKCPHKCTPNCIQNLTTTTTTSRRSRSPSALPDTDPTTSDFENFTTIHSTNTLISTTSYKCYSLNCSIYQIANYTSCECDCKENWSGPECKNYNCSIPDPYECTINAIDCSNQTVFFNCPNTCTPICNPITVIPTTTSECDIFQCNSFEIFNQSACACDCKENWSGPECKNYNCSIPDPNECTINAIDCSNQTVFFNCPNTCTPICNPITVIPTTTSECDIFQCNSFEIFNQSACACDCKENWSGPECKNYNCSIPDPYECTINAIDCSNQANFFDCPNKCSPICNPITVIPTTTSECDIFQCNSFEIFNQSACACDCKENWSGPECKNYNCSIPDPYECTINAIDCSNQTVFFNCPNTCTPICNPITVIPTTTSECDIFQCNSFEIFNQAACACDCKENWSGPECKNYNCSIPDPYECTINAIDCSNQANFFDCPNKCSPICNPITVIPTTTSECDIFQCNSFEIFNQSACACDCKENWSGPECKNYNCSIPDPYECTINAIDCSNQANFFDCPNKCSPICNPITVIPTTTSECDIFQCNSFEIFNQSACVCDCKENRYGPDCKNYNCSIPDPYECTINAIDCSNLSDFIKCPQNCSSNCQYPIYSLCGNFFFFI